MKKHLAITVIVALAAITASAQRTPTMGWSSWNTFALDINEQLIRQQADAMHNTGLQQAGYQFVNIDDGYWDGRGSDGNLRLNKERFPSGMRSLVDYIHSLGLKAGIYSDAGDNTCGSGNKHAWGLGVGFAGHEEKDCRLYFDDWDFDFIKVDYCGGAHIRLDEREQYTKISNAIKSVNKKGIVYNMCRWAYPGTWSADVADSWRTTGDIYDAWRSVKGILAENLCLSAYCHDGHDNDMDMLEVGRSMSQVEDETHFAMWCIMASPLLIGCDMANIRPESLKLLCNKDLIALNQDALHLQAYLAKKIGECYLMVKDIKELHGTERAFAVYNPTDREYRLDIYDYDLDLLAPMKLHDCIAQRDFPVNHTAIHLIIPAHGTKCFTTKGEARRERTMYEAETAYLSCYQELRNNVDAETAVYGARENASGGHVAGFLGKKAENDLQWRDVYVNACGKRDVALTYFSGEQRSITIEVNGKLFTTVTVGGPDWETPQRTIIKDLPLSKGSNIIRLYNADGWMPDIDCLELL